MTEIKIEHLGYLLKQAKKNNKPQPIFFLGAGASRSGQIPLAREIIKEIHEEYSESPFLKGLQENEKNYPKLMSCLLPNQRDELLKKYIDKAKINVTHIYLAQLIKQDYVDYVLTVNFDNLMLRALALYNIFPSTYDMAILKDLTTSTFKEKSVVYLHGQSHGLWLLNTPEEMEKVKNTVPRIFDAIKNQRPWVFIGYSGDDPIFDHIKNLGRFDNGLYWVTFNETNPSTKVQTFLTDPTTNAFVIKGYDSDSFMLKLNNELGLMQPVIIDTPFTALKHMLEEIVDINEKEHFKGVKERLDISKKQVGEAIQQFEKGNTEVTKGISENRVDILKKEIINLIVSEKYEETVIHDIEQKVNKNPDKETQDLIATLYYNWGVDLGYLAKTKEGQEAENLYHQSFEKYRKAIEIKPDMHEAYYNWGTDLGRLANTKEGKEAEEFYQQSFEMFRKTIEIKPDNHEAYNNWGSYLGNLTKTKEGKKAEDLYLQLFDKYRKAIEIKPDKHVAYYNWGIYLGNFAKIKKGKEAEEFYQESFEKYRKAIEIKPDMHEAYNNWGNDLGNLAKTKEGKDVEDLYKQSFEKYHKAIEIRPDKHEVYHCWGIDLGNFAKTKEGKEAEELYQQSFEMYRKAIEIKPDNKETYDSWAIDLGNLAKIKEGNEAEELYRQSIEMYRKAIALGGSSYNLACAYAVKGNKKDALLYLDLSLLKSEIQIDFVEKDEDWKAFLNDSEFVETLKKYK